MKWGEALGYAGRKDEARAQYHKASTLDLAAADKAELTRISAQWLRKQKARLRVRRRLGVLTRLQWLWPCTEPTGRKRTHFTPKCVGSAYNPTV
jgi:hypothetical protein